MKINTVTMKEEIEDILMNSYDKFGLFDESKATKELLNLFNDMKKNKKRKLDWADLACQQAMDRTLNQITVPEVFLKEENKLKKG